jgi:long-chain fatty acid transport protein
MGAALAGTIAAVLPTAGLQAAGYGVGYDSVVATAVAGAGGGAAAGDASAAYFNPAGMMLVDRSQFTGGAHLVIPRIDFTNRNTRSRNGTLVPGNDGGDGGEDAAVPHIHGIWVVNPQTRLGLSINSPYGLVTSWDGGFVGRYNELTTALKTVNVNPSVAFQLNPQLSIGGGVSAIYGRARLSQGIDFGAALGLGDTTQDGSGEFGGTDISYGFNLGLLYQFTPATRLSLHYRSEVRFEFDGEAEF